MQQESPAKSLKKNINKKANAKGKIETKRIVSYLYPIYQPDVQLILKSIVWINSTVLVRTRQVK